MSSLGLAIDGHGIRTDAHGRVSLNDCQHAAGGEDRHRPSRWLANLQTRALIAELETDGIPAVSTSQGRRGGTFAVEPLVVAYAAWVSARFHLQVVNTFLASKKAAAAGPAINSLESALNDPATLRALLVHHTDARLRLEVEIDAQAPRVAAYDRMTLRQDAMSLTAAGKVLGVAPHQFFEWLATLGWIYRAADHGSWLGASEPMRRGHITHRLCEIKRAVGFTQIKPQVLLTLAGVATLARKLEEAATVQTIAHVEKSCRRQSK